MFLGDFLFKAAIQYQKHPRTPSRSKCSDRFREIRREDNTTVRATLAALAPRLTKCQTPWSGRGMLWEASSRTQACAPVCATQPKITSSTWRTQHVYTHHISYIIYGYIYIYIYIWLYRGLIQIISSAHGYFWWIINYLRETFGAPTFFFRGVVVIAFVLLRRAQITCM